MFFKKEEGDGDIKPPKTCLQKPPIFQQNPFYFFYTVNKPSLVLIDVLRKQI